VNEPAPQSGLRLPHWFGLRLDVYRPDRGPGRDRVGYMELFFDLVFVFAITQETGLITRHPSVETLAATLIVGLAVWWTWIDTAWITNWLDPDRGPVRGMLLTLMAGSLIISATTGDALGPAGELFAVTLVVINIARPAFAVVALGRHHPSEAANFLNLSIWAIFSAPLWLLGAFDPAHRLAWWAIGLAIDLVAPLLRYALPAVGRTPLHAWRIRGKHLSERVSLFILIALGESVVVIGEHVSEQRFTLALSTALVGAFVQTVLLWFLYFNHGEALGSRRISGTDLTGAIARSSFTYIPSLLVLGIIFDAVGTELVLEHPAAPATGIWEAALVTGSTALYLLGDMLFRRSIGDRVLLSHLSAIAFLLLVFLARDVLPANATVWLSTGPVGYNVVVDQVRNRRGVTNDPDVPLES
jgi:low temperature requirement protein LtrA